MKKISYIFIIILIVVISCTCVLVGCGGNKPSNGDDNGSNGGSTIQPPAEKPEQPGEQPSAPTWDTEAYDNFVALMKTTGNYTFSKKENGKTTTYKFDKDILEVKEQDKSESDFYTKEGSSYRKYIFNEDEYLWHRYESDAHDFNGIILNMLENGAIVEYNNIGFYLEFGGESYEIVLNKDKDYIFLNKDGKELKIGSVGKTETPQLPDSRFIVIEEEKEPPVVDPDPGEEKPPVVVEDKIYEIVNGKRVYNFDLIAETAIDALNTEVGGKKLCAYVASSLSSVDNVKFATETENGIEIGATYTSKFGDTGFAIFNIANANFEKADNKTALTNILLEDKLITRGFSVTIDLSSDDATIAQKLIPAAQNVVNLLATKGVQSKVGVSGTPLTYLKNAKVLYAFTEESSSPTNGYMMGNINETPVNALVKLSNGELRFINTKVATNIYSGQTPIEVMVNNLENKVLVFRAEESLVNESYVQESNTQKNVLQLRQEVVKQNAILNENRRSFIDKGRNK